MLHASMIAQLFVNKEQNHFSGNSFVFICYECEYNTKSNILILIQRLTADGAYSPIFECDESALVQVNFILFFKKKNKQKQ